MTDLPSSERHLVKVVEREEEEGGEEEMQGGERNDRILTTRLVNRESTTSVFSNLQPDVPVQAYQDIASEKRR